MARASVPILIVAMAVVLAACIPAAKAGAGWTFAPALPTAAGASQAAASPIATSSAVPATPTASASASASPSASASESPTASAPPASSDTDTIVVSEWQVVMAGSVKAGKIAFTISNAGAEPHELLAFRSDLDPAKYPTQANGDIDESGPGITQVTDGENIDPAGSQARTIDLSVPGKYLFMCNIPGHFAKGMFEVVTVRK